MRVLEPHKPVLAAVSAWAAIVMIVRGFLFLKAWWLYPVVALLVAGRAGVFLQLAHEAAHGLVSKGRFNDWFGRWIGSYPLGLDFEGYKLPHMRHHACVNQPCDPLSDSEKQKIVDVRDPRLLLLFVKDLLGITAFDIRQKYDRPETNLGGDPYGAPGAAGAFAATPARAPRKKAAGYWGAAFVQGLILAALFRFNVLHYLALWIAPLLTAHMFLMRVRGIAEHGLGKQLEIKDLARNNRGTFYTRSFSTRASAYGFKPLVWIEKALIGSLNVNYHHEHHLYPKVPYYNLPKVHELIQAQVKEYNPGVYALGYFDCLFFNLRPRPSLKTSY